MWPLAGSGSLRSVSKAMNSSAEDLGLQRAAGMTLHPAQPVGSRCTAGLIWERSWSPPTRSPVGMRPVLHRCALTASRPATHTRGGPAGYYLWCWENPHPDERSNGSRSSRAALCSSSSASRPATLMRTRSSAGAPGVAGGEGRAQRRRMHRLRGITHSAGRFHRCTAYGPGQHRQRRPGRGRSAAGSTPDGRYTAGFRTIVVTVPSVLPAPVRCGFRPGWAARSRGSHSATLTADGAGRLRLALSREPRVTRPRPAAKMSRLTRP
jgi:hypothetical protein